MGSEFFGELRAEMFLIQPLKGNSYAVFAVYFEQGIHLKVPKFVILYMFQSPRYDATGSF